MVQPISVLSLAHNGSQPKTHRCMGLTLMKAQTNVAIVNGCMEPSKMVQTWALGWCDPWHADDMTRFDVMRKMWWTELKKELLWQVGWMLDNSQFKLIFFEAINHWEALFHMSAQLSILSISSAIWLNMNSFQCSQTGQVQSIFVCGQGEVLQTCPNTDTQAENFMKCLCLLLAVDWGPQAKSIMLIQKRSQDQHLLLLGMATGCGLAVNSGTVLTLLWERFEVWNSKSRSEINKTYAMTHARMTCAQMTNVPVIRVVARKALVALHVTIEERK